MKKLSIMKLAWVQQAYTGWRMKKVKTFENKKYTNMKTKNIILLCALLMSSGTVFAQIIPVATLDCGWNYIYDNAGNRKARVYSNFNCPPSSGKTDETEIDIVTLYPNPTNGNFQIEFNKELDNAEVIVIDNSGKLLLREFHSGLTVPLDLSGKAAGVYHVTVRHGDKYKSKSVVKVE